MIRPILLLALIAALASAAAPALAAPLKLERVVFFQRHGVRPPTSSNADLAKYAAEPWPDWPVPAGELTPHGGETVRLMGADLRRVYQSRGLLPAGCPGDGQVSVWADGADQRTRRSGEITAEALAPGCGVKAAWAPPLPRDPVYNGPNDVACKSEPSAARAALMAALGPGPLDTPATRRGIAKIQAIFAPDACKGGKGTCFSGADTIADTPIGPRVMGPMATTAALAEDLVLEYAEGLPAAQVGWGRAASVSAIATAMAVHERTFGAIRHNPYLGARMGSIMARMTLAALAGTPNGAVPGPQYGPKARIVDFSGHDTNIALMGAVFGLDWTLPGQPDVTSPAQTLALELWRDPASGKAYVRAVMYYETLEQMRTLKPTAVKAVPLKFNGCDDGPGGGCSLDKVTAHVEALLPPGCGEI